MGLSAFRGQPLHGRMEKGLEVRSARQRDELQGYLYVAPSILLLVLFLVFPLLYVIVISFYKIQPMVSQSFVLFDNYRNVFRDPSFWQSLQNTFVFTLASIALHLVIGMIVALMLNRTFPLRTASRVLILLPWMLSYTVVAITWRWCLNSTYGILNEVLLRFGVIREYVAWLGDTRTAMPAVILTNAWKYSPFVMLMLLAGLQAIPRQQYEAAHIDGAGPWQSFWAITLPNLRDVVVVTTTLDFIWTFKKFDLIYVMTGGGPGRSTEVMSTLIYNNFFHAYDFGFASGAAVILFLVVFVISCFYVRLMKMGGMNA